MNNYRIERPKDLGMLVVVGGPGGSGSSTIAKLLALRWELHRVDAGEIMRNSSYREEIVDFLKTRATAHSEIDKNIDKFLVQMSYYPNMLIEGKAFAALCTQIGIPTTIKIWVGASVDARVRRILEREGKLEKNPKITPRHKAYQDARKAVLERQSNDIRRWRKLYNLDLSKPELYNDIVLDTSNLNVSHTMKKLIEMISENEKLRNHFPPKYLRF